MNEAGDFGLRFGFTVPIHNADGDIVSVTFGGDRFELTDNDRRALHLIAIYANNKVQDLLGPRPANLTVPKLSPREAEVLRWCATGMSSQDIADKLKIAYTTVDTHITRACMKLDVGTRTQAVAVAIRAGLID
jgi:LuxR family quorum sensing-dependent transcriptional regulator